MDHGCTLWVIYPRWRALWSSILTSTRHIWSCKHGEQMCLICCDTHPFPCSRTFQKRRASSLLLFKLAWHLTLYISSSNFVVQFCVLWIASWATSFLVDDWKILPQSLLRKTRLSATTYIRGECVFAAADVEMDRTGHCTASTTEGKLMYRKNCTGQ